MPLLNVLSQACGGPARSRSLILRLPDLGRVPPPKRRGVHPATVMILLRRLQEADLSVGIENEAAGFVGYTYRASSADLATSCKHFRLRVVQNPTGLE